MYGIDAAVLLQSVSKPFPGLWGWKKKIGKVSLPDFIVLTFSLSWGSFLSYKGLLLSDHVWSGASFSCALSLSLEENLPYLQ
jgi:hypothetical protein